MYQDFREMLLSWILGNLVFSNLHLNRQLIHYIEICHRSILPCQCRSQKKEWIIVGVTPHIHSQLTGLNSLKNGHKIIKIWEG